MWRTMGSDATERGVAVAVEPEPWQAPIVPSVGGGPAGMSCALWLSNYGLRPLIVETQAVFGGMARRDPYPNPWLLGRPGLLGRDNAAEFARHIEAIKVEGWCRARPRHVRRLAGG